VKSTNPKEEAMITGLRGREKEAHSKRERKKLNCTSVKEERRVREVTEIAKQGTRFSR